MKNEKPKTTFGAEVALAAPTLGPGGAAPEDPGGIYFLQEGFILSRRVLFSPGGDLFSPGGIYFLQEDAEVCVQEE